MTLLEKLDALKKTTGDTNASLARNSGVPYTTIDGLYKKGYANVKLSTLMALCDYFNVSLDYLAKDSVTSDLPSEDQPTMPGGLNEKDMEFGKVFNALSAQNRRILLVLATALLKEQVTHPDIQE